MQALHEFVHGVCSVLLLLFRLLNRSRSRLLRLCLLLLLILGLLACRRSWLLGGSKYLNLWLDDLNGLDLFDFLLFRLIDCLCFLLIFLFILLFGCSRRLLVRLLIFSRLHVYRFVDRSKLGQVQRLPLFAAHLLRDLILLLDHVVAIGRLVGLVEIYLRLRFRIVFLQVLMLLHLGVR